MYVQFVYSALGNEDGGVQLVYEATCCLAWGVIFDRRRDRSVVCVFSIFDAGGSVCGCRCVYTHTHTYTAHMGYSDVSPEVVNTVTLKKKNRGLSWSLGAAPKRRRAGWWLVSLLLGASTMLHNHVSERCDLEILPRGLEFMYEVCHKETPILS